MKKDLLGECNDQKMSEVEFTSLFCKRCKNKECGRAGWASSSWEERIATQADRFLNPTIVSQHESNRWEGLVNLESLEPTGEIEVWGAPVREAPPMFEEVAPIPISEPISEAPLPPPVAPSEPVEVSSPTTNPVEPIEGALEPLPSAPKRIVNTPPQQIMVEGVDRPNTNPAPKPVDAWATPPKTLKVGGTFKMGG